MNRGRLSVEFRARTKKYASSAIRLFVKLPKNQEEVRVLGRQLLRSGTSVAAHVREAARARSDAEFCSKIEGALQEADESELWLELLRDDCGIQTAALKELLRETGELMAIFVTMVNRTKGSGD
jgi:four helix bundle protein